MLNPLESVLPCWKSWIYFLLQAMIATMDVAVGQVMEEVSRQDKLGETIVIFASDVRGSWDSDH